MTLLVRTNPNEPGYRGLSMLLAEKPRGTDDDPFPAAGMTGTEIEVLGYRGMKEYEIAFDGFEVQGGEPARRRRGPGLQAADADLRVGAHPDRGARHRRGAGGDGAGADLCAQQRKQFGEPIINFPRVADKIAMMAVEIMIARQLTYFAAREKDPGRRCDLEAGMAKLLAARVAWANADNAVQIHGGNGFALEFPVSPHPVRRPHPQHLRGRRRNPGPGHRAAAARARRTDPNGIASPGVCPSKKIDREQGRHGRAAA